MQVNRAARGPSRHRNAAAPSAGAVQGFHMRHVREEKTASVSRTGEDRVAASSAHSRQRRPFPPSQAHTS